MEEGKAKAWDGQRPLKDGFMGNSKLLRRVFAIGLRTLSLTLSYTESYYSRARLRIR